MKKIESVNNEYIKSLLKLHDKKYRAEKKEFLIEGYHLVSEAKNFLKAVLITKESDEVKGVENYLVTDNIINKLSFTKTPQAIIGVCNYFESINDDLFSHDRYLLLDNIQDPGNLGTLVRSALGFKIDVIFLSEESVDIYNDKFIRSTQGAIFKTKVVKGALVEIIRKLKENGVYVLGTSLKSNRNLEEVESLEKYALVLGNEANGVSRAVLEETSENIRIETSSSLESLNVGVAGGIILYYLDRKNNKLKL